MAAKSFIKLKPSKLEKQGLKRHMKRAGEDKDAVAIWLWGS